jgi:two-component system chemotaxis response regulator CheB
MFSRPSIDVLFESASDVLGSRIVGIVLTGANRDGAIGLSKICAGGGIGLVQDPETAYSQAMPKAALGACSDAVAMDLVQIAERIIEEGGVS